MRPEHGLGRQSAHHQPARERIHWFRGEEKNSYVLV